ncbi:Uncharacterised protein [Mycobacteroides abscessus subsp. abscessus]|nr:Uncharacterised protein [Mycobacteroides abscessus subsp. abscessus]
MGPRVSMMRTVQAEKPLRFSAAPEATVSMSSPGAARAAVCDMRNSLGNGLVCRSQSAPSG